MTRLADVDEMAQAPPEGVRTDLRPGEVAGLYAVRPPSMDGWGEGLEPFEAMVVDVPAPGVYVGELPDGQPVQFGERNVAWVGPSMGGIFDWVKRAFRPEEPPPPVPGPGLPAIPPKAPPPGLPALPPPPSPPSPLKEAFFKLFAPSRLPAAPPAPPPPGAVIEAEPGAKPSIFDWFRPKRAVPPGPPALRPEGAPVPYVAPPSMFAPFAPAAPGILERIEEKDKAIVPAEAPGLPIQAPEIFRHIKPTPEEDFEAKKARQQELWQNLFPEPEPGKDVPLEEMFKPFRPEELRPEPARPGAPPVAPEMLPPVETESLKILTLPPRNELLPTTTDLARALVTRYEPIEELWDLIRRARQDPAFQRAVAKGMAGEGPGARYAFETLGMCDGNPNAFEAVAAFFQIPWGQVVARGQPVTKTDDEGNQYTSLTNLDRIYEEITFPAAELLFQAFEMIKPPDLSAGTFMLEWGGHAEHTCQLLVTYAEGFPYAPGDVPDPAVFQQPEPEPPPPEGFTTVGEMMPPEATVPVTEILNAMLREEITRKEARERIIELLEQEPHKAFLQAKGVLPVYLAGWLTAMVGRTPEEQQMVYKEIQRITAEGKEKAQEGEQPKRKKRRE